MEILDNSPERNLNPLTSSVVDSRVKTSAKPESEPELKALARAFGLSSPASLGSFDPDTFSLKTFQACLFPTGTESESIQLEYPEWLESWPDSGMWDADGVYALQTSGPVTSESACLLWPTASGSVANDGESLESWERRKAKNLELYDNGNGMGTPLTIAASRWPTARQEDGESCGNHPGAVDSLTGATKEWDTWRTPDTPGQGRVRNRQGSIGAGHQITIAEQAEHWQTPATDSFRSQGGDRKDEQGLDQQARMFPTPANQDYRTPNLLPGAERGMGTKGEQLPNFVKHCCPLPLVPQTPDGPQSSETTPGSPPPSKRRLNPVFVEFLMGLPIGWTEL